MSAIMRFLFTSSNDDTKIHRYSFISQYKKHIPSEFISTEMTRSTTFLEIFAQTTGVKIRKITAKIYLGFICVRKIQVPIDFCE